MEETDHIIPSHVYDLTTNPAKSALLTLFKFHRTTVGDFLTLVKNQSLKKSPSTSPIHLIQAAVNLRAALVMGNETPTERFIQSIGDLFGYTLAEVRSISATQTTITFLDPAGGQSLILSYDSRDGIPDVLTADNDLNKGDIALSRT